MEYSRTTMAQERYIYMTSRADVKPDIKSNRHTTYGIDPRLISVPISPEFDLNYDAYVINNQHRLYICYTVLKYR